jgi:hypothetical protein
MIDFGVAYHPALWTVFFSVEASVSAGLTGLLFVAISINLSQITSSPLLIARSAKALSTLVGVLLAASLCLVPGQSLILLGVELVILGTLAWGMITLWQRSATHKNPYVSSSARVLHDVLAQGSSLPMIACGISLIVGREGGLYWLVAGMIVALIAALLDAWVLLIEIQR